MLEPGKLNVQRYFIQGSSAGNSAASRALSSLSCAWLPAKKYKRAAIFPETYNDRRRAGNRMNRRISLWALAGFAVGCFWFAYSTITWPNSNLGRSLLVAITAPASVLGRFMPLAFYWFILLNAAAYALFGLATELVRRVR
jgi:hypothetical protein